MDEYISRREFAETTKRFEAEDNRQNKRLEVLENNAKQTTDLTIAVNRMATTMEQMLKEQKAQGERLQNLESVPSKNWITIKNGVLTAIAAAIGGGLITLIIETLVR